MTYLDAHLAKLRLEEDLHGAMYKRYVDAFDYSTEAQRTPVAAPDFDTWGGSDGGHLKSIIDTVRAAETFTVAPQMMALVRAAAEEMPNEPLMPQDLPSLQGFLYLSDPFSETDLHGRVLREHIVTWTVMQYDHKQTDTQRYGVYLNWFTDRDDQLDEVNAEIRAQDPDKVRQVGKYVLMAANTVYFGEPIPNSPDMSAIRELDKAGLPEDWRRHYLVQEEAFINIDPYTGESERKTRYVPVKNSDSILTEEQFEIVRQAYFGMERKIRDNYSLKQLICFWRLCQQTISGREYAHPDRAMSKLLRRRQFSASPVTVITLRRRRQTNSDSETEVEWDHRWLRRGHWRQQWYGSGEERHQRAIYINPTICGPEDKPLLIRPHVNLLTR